MSYDTVGGVELTALRGRCVGVPDGLRIHALDDRKALLAHAP
jgi:hypothetical protein